MNHTQSTRKHFVKRRIDQAIHDALKIALKRGVEKTFQLLLGAVYLRSNLLRSEPPTGRVLWPDCDIIFRGLLAVAAYRKHWVRELYDWRPGDGSRYQQSRSLILHLLATHPVPEFLTKVWFEEMSAQTQKHQKLFRHVALGNNIRGANLPIDFTKLMAQQFAMVPHQLSVDQAIRWCQVRGLGGDISLANSLVKTQLGASFRDERYWQTVILFLVQHSQLNLKLVEPIVEYLDLNRNSHFRDASKDRRRCQFNRLLNDVQKWLAAKERKEASTLSWKGLNIGSFRFHESPDTVWEWKSWTIHELLSRQELVEEGLELKHCVATYANSCARGRTSIWSLRCHGTLSTHRVLTIEVNPQEKQIVTALGNCNSRPKPEARKIMATWASQQHLTIARWVR